MQGAGGKLLVLLGLCVLPTLGTLRLLQELGVLWPALAYGVMSLLSFVLYWHDKARAQQGGWRIPENTLHLSELFGGWPGALLAQQLFRHKTRKLPFQLIFWGIVLVHQLAWADWLAGGRLIGHLLLDLWSH
ncbi:DUF1294 domain-containing protein [Zestomonas insulae]|uniref:DUF1294 domain-containing protein n=1 Tax=Zestomonas insulae TaxID=2809017 RepID=UPI003211A506